MKKLHLLKMIFLLCALVVGSGSAWAVDYELYSGTITEGDYVIVYSGKAMKNSISSNRLEYWSVTPANNKISNPEATIVWHIAASGDYWTIYNAAVSKYAASTGSKNQAKLEDSVTDNSKWTVTGTSTYEFENKARAAADSDNDKKWLRNNGTYGFACYASSTGGELSLYKKVASSKEPAGLSYSTSKYSTTFGASFPTPSLTNPNSLSVTYSSSDATIADVNSTTGAVTIKSKMGNATITASTEGNDDYEAGSASYKIYVYEHDGTAANKAFTVTEANDFIKNTLYADEETKYYVSGIVSQTNSTISSGKNTYYISDNGTKTNQLQVFQGKDLENANFTTSTLVKWGENVIVYGPLLLYNNKNEINTGNYLYSITRKTAPNLTVHADINNFEVTQEIPVSDLYSTVSEGNVTIVSDNEEVSNIISNKLVALKPGTAKITVTVAFNNSHAGEEKSFNVTVTVKDPVAPAGLNDVGFKKVTTEGDVASGEYLIVYEGGNVVFNGSLATLDDGNNYIGVTISNNTIPALETLKAATFTYDATNHTLVSKSGKYIGRGEYSNGLTQADAATLTNSLSIDGGNVVITALNSEGTGTDAGKFTTLRYNSTNSPYRFRYYKTGQQAIQLYKLSSTTTYTVSIGETGYKTLISAASATLPDGLTAYKAVSAGEGKINLTSVASIKAGCAYILKGTASTDYTLTVTNSPEEPTGNILEVSTESSGNGCYVLANGSSGVGFYKWTGGSLGAGRAIVPASEVSTARGFLEFCFDDEDVTSVNELKTQKADIQYFNLAGQRVAQPTKGLYIVNGKKVIIK